MVRGTCDSLLPLEAWNARDLVYENLHLVQAASFEEARPKAERASEAAGDDLGTLTLNGEPAERVFLGIRKVVLCENSTEPPVDGNELTYNKFEVETRFTAGCISAEAALSGIPPRGKE